jgi:hypothetical protein
LYIVMKSYIYMLQILFVWIKNKHLALLHPFSIAFFSRVHTTIVGFNKFSLPLNRYKSENVNTRRAREESFFIPLHLLCAHKSNSVCLLAKHFIVKIKYWKKRQIEDSVIALAVCRFFLSKQFSNNVHTSNGCSKVSW